jgi:hypothetical protein
LKNIEDNDDEYYDIDDDDPRFFYEIGVDEELDIIGHQIEEDIPVIT